MALLCLGTARAQPLRVLCIGDSITQGGRGDRPEYTYRLPLQRMLKALGRDVDFIGSRSTGLDGLSWPADFDPDHEGYYGKTAAVIRDNVLANLPGLPAPDVALINMGTNDIRTWSVKDNITGPLEAIVEALRERNPRVLVLVADPGHTGLRGLLLRYRLARVTSSLHSGESPVHLVAAPAGWSSVDTFDGSHPNERGQARQAIQWLAAMEFWLPAPDLPVLSPP